MDPNAFIGALLGALGAAIASHPSNAGVVCDRRGFCVAQPQFQQPYYPPPPVYIPPPPRPQVQAAQPPAQPDALGAKVKSGIYEFCNRHPEEPFCGDLDRYLQQHPDAR